MIPALMTNLLGIAIFETYRNTQRGLANFGAMTAFYILANVVQFCAVMILGLAGFHSAIIFVAVYGLTNVAALGVLQDRKSTRLNSSHVAISYAVFCLKK